ncbi:MAG: hypothetical protein NTW60_00415, partial [Candidatus Wolfebacteria bacterium]|nr:hypothetical protein [Candidatus Wolfebacteria bacterium]
KISDIKSGDYFIVPPQAATKNISREYLDSLKKDYDLIFETRSGFAFPNMNLKILVKNLIAGNDNGLVKNKNTSQSLDYYVFIKK